MNHDRFLSNFESVSPDRSSPNSFKAKCPAHDDGKPSLAITDLGNKWVLHCWAGCSNADILAALGLTWSALFSDTDKLRKQVGPTSAEKLSVIEHELRCVETGLARAAAGQALSNTDKQRLRAAAKFCIGVASRGRR